MSDLAEFFGRSADLFDERVRAVGDDHWDHGTPCTEWSVRDLVNHLTNECLWVPPLLRGQTIEEVGDRFDGDCLGDDPVGSWADAVADARAAATETGALDRTVNLSFGNVPGHVYIAQVGTDLLVHSWDLARGIGYDETLPKDLMEVAYEGAKGYEKELRDSGLFGDKFEAAPGASFQEEFLGFFGRRS